MTISAAAIDLMVGAGASCAQLAIVARRHFPKISETIDALISADTPVAVVAALIKAEAADCGAAAREAEKRKANTKSQQKCRAKARTKRAEVIQLNEPELPLSSVSYDSDDRRDSGDHRDPSPSSSSPPHPPNNYSPSHSEPDGSDAVASKHEIVVLNENPKARLFRIGLTVLTSFGVPENQQRPLIGMWLKLSRDPAGVLAAIQSARDQNAVEPVAYISKLINGDRSDTNRSAADRQPGGLACLAVELGAAEFGARTRHRPDRG